MRISNQAREIIETMEGQGFVWLSHLPVNAQVRFRTKLRTGKFTSYIKRAGLVFFYRDVADLLTQGVKTSGRPRLTISQQLENALNKIELLNKEKALLRKIIEDNNLDAPREE